MPILDPFSQNNVFYRGATTQLEKDDPAFFDVVAATVGYQYDPIIEYVSNAIKFRGEEDPNYRPLEDIEGYEAYRDDLLEAKNAEHMTELKRAIDENIERRNVLAKASFGQHFFAGLADPINLVALPFGGIGVGVARSFLRTGASVAALQAGQELARAPFDPLNQPYEPAINIGSAFMAGGLLGSALSVPASRRAAAFESTKKALSEDHAAVLRTQPDVDTRLPTPTADRPLSQVENYELDAVTGTAPRVIAQLEETLDAAKTTLNERRAAFDRAVTPDDMAKTKAPLDEAEEAVTAIEAEVAARRDEYALFKNEADQRVADKAAIDAMDDPYGLPKNLWTDSPFYKFVTTPMKRVLQDSKVTDKAKKVILSIAGDSGILLNMHRGGLRLGPSVYQKAAMRDGEWVQVYDELRTIYGNEFGKGKQTILDYDVGSVTQKLAEKAKIQPKNITFQDYMTNINKKRMRGEAAATDGESRAMKLLDDFYETWEGRLSQTGLIGNMPFYKNKSILLEGDIAKRQAIIDDLKAKKNLTDLEKDRLSHNQRMLSRLKDQKEDIDFQIEAMKDFPMDGKYAEKFHPRYWLKGEVESRRAELHAILTDWYTKNPYVFVLNEKTGKYQRVRTDVDTAGDRANETIDKILGLDDVAAESNAFYGYGRSKHFRHRDVDIPNALVIDFIETNPIAVMKAYTAKVAPQFELQVKFGKGIDDILDEVEDDLLAAGVNRLRINRTLRDIRHLNDRVQGQVIRNPEAINYKTAIILKDLAMLNYLGSAGFATLPDFAKVMMEHEMGTVFKSLFGVMIDNRVRMSAREGRIAGEIIDILKGDAHLRFSENMINNPLNEGLMSKVRTGFFMLNGVAPMTTIFKKMDAIARGHTLIDYSVRYASGELKKDSMEVAYLARYNIGKQEAIEIANAPWDKTDGGLYLPNTEKWTTGRTDDLSYTDAKNGVRPKERKTSQGTVENFRTAMNSGIGNTVLMGTPADKPIAVDGVFYVPMHIARQVGMKEDPKFKGYARIENGILSMPFQFLSYSFAAANKITASIAQNQVKNRNIAIAASMGLGYMGMELKYKDWQMERMTLDEKIARSFDASGVAALYSDLFYTSMGISMALGGPDIGMGIIKPKFKQDKDVLDAITGIGGAGPSYALDVGRGVATFMQGDYGEGAGEILRKLPGAQLFFLKDTTNEAARAFAGGRY